MNDEVQTWHCGLVARYWVENITTGFATNEAEKTDWTDADATADDDVIVYFARK